MAIDIPSDVCVLVANQGVGDHYIVGALAEAVGRQHGLRVWVAGRADMAFLPKIFPAVEQYVAWPANRDLSSGGPSRIAGGDFYYAHFPKLELMRAVGYNGFHFLDAYRCRLGLPVSAPLTPGRCSSPAEKRAAEGALRGLGLKPGRTVILSIEARSTPTDGVDRQFWTALAEELLSAGLQPVVNAAAQTVVPDGMRPLPAPLFTLRPLAEAAGFVCTIRSGLSELFCDLPCSQAVVYPDVPYWSGSLREGTTLTRYGLPFPPREFVVRSGNAASQAREIAQAFRTAQDERTLRAAV